MAGTAELVFIVSYRCPHCQAALESRTSGEGAGAASWLRCPKCGRASLPPEEAASRAPAPPPPGEDDRGIGGYPEPRPLTPADLAGAEIPAGAPARGGARRVGVASALFVSVTMLVFSSLDESPLGTSVFGALALALLLVLIFLSRRGS